MAGLLYYAGEDERRFHGVGLTLVTPATILVGFKVL
jgi:hypothetical protein